MAWHDVLAVLADAGRLALLPPGRREGLGPALAMAAAFWMATHVVQVDMALREAWARVIAREMKWRRRRGFRRLRRVGPPADDRNRSAWLVLSGRPTGFGR
jgi:hypothetical protein